MKLLYTLISYCYPKNCNGTVLNVKNSQTIPKKNQQDDF